jgi:hypothetical protein
MTDQQKPKRTGRKVLIGVIIFIVIFLAIGALSSGGDADTNKPKSAANYEAQVTNYSVTDPATLRVDVKVHNIGTESGKPSCHIEADNGTRAYHGFDRVERPEPLDADEWWGFAQNITITNQGAEHIKDVTVECK